VLLSDLSPQFSPCDIPQRLHPHFLVTAFLHHVEVLQSTAEHVAQVQTTHPRRTPTPPPAQADHRLLHRNSAGCEQRHHCAVNLAPLTESFQGHRLSAIHHFLISIRRAHNRASYVRRKQLRQAGVSILSLAWWKWMVHCLVRPEDEWRASFMSPVSVRLCEFCTVGCTAKALPRVKGVQLQW